ncbi:MAG: RluA family pseudouridine synthase [Oscillospiraceae bacterium]|nr:RluA family pseudouridine synthase [Oscillospiraceae bacterium]
MTGWSELNRNNDVREREDTIEFVVEQASDGMTCAEFLRKCGVSRRLVTKLKRVPMGITRGNELVRTIDEVFAGEVIVLKNVDESLLEPNENLNVPIAYEDENLVVFNKPDGMPVHPSIKHQGDTLGNCFSAMFPKLTFRPINRLDKDTSGLCAVAKNAHAANIYSGSIKKIYYAVTEGKPIPDAQRDGIEWTEKTEGVYRINAPIGRAGESIIRREVRSDGQQAVTNYTIEKSNEKFSLVRVNLETGRTHQIRVHFSSVGHPLAGDDFYGGSLECFKAQALHCGEMSFTSVNGEKIEVVCPLREDMLAVFE